MRTETDISGRMSQGVPPGTPGLRLVESATPEGQGLIDLVLPVARPTVIGRDPGERGLGIADAKMSSRHITVYPGADGTLHYLDHESKNGVFINGMRGASGKLDDGDVLRCGTTLFVVVTVPAAGLPHDLEDAAADRVGASPVIQATWARARSAGAHDVPVLVLGETGSGKEGVARLVHAASGRDGPFIPVNCAALTAEDASGALFGHERGALPGVAGERRGFFREAERGTLFLDEIGDLPLDVQPRLLRALEQREITPLGASRPLAVDVRVVAATNVDLSARIVQGTFRADLWARLAAWLVEVPPLGARREDVLRLARHFAGRPPYGRSPLAGTPLFDVELAERLLLHPWPFNVRELRQVVLALRVVAAPPWSLVHLPRSLARPGDASAVLAPAPLDLEDTAPQPPRDVHDEDTQNSERRRPASSR